MRNDEDDRELIKKQLEEARAMLLAGSEAGKPETSGLLAAVENALAANDFAAAVDALGRAGQLAHPPGRFWQTLQSVAKKLGLAEKARDFEYIWAEGASLSLTQGLRRK
jgi:Flp pilus assembly protein TadD